MKKYATYKPSGVEWLGEVPAHWQVLSLRRLFNVRSGDQTTTEDLIDEGFPVFGGNGFRGYYPDWNTDANSILIGRYGALCGNVRVVREKVWATEHAFRVFPLMPFNVDFLAYSLESINLNQFSARAAQPGLNATLVRENTCALPPLPEQRAIAAFLDERTAHLDGLIRRKEDLLKLLAEQRAALITRTVTRGLNPAAPLQDPGVPWLGQVPAHWQVKRLKYMLDDIEQGWSPQCDNQPAEAGEWGVLKVGCVNGDAFDPMENKRLPADLDPLLKYEVQPGDVLMSRANTKELVGSTAIVRELPTRLMLCDKLYRLQVPASKVDKEFLVYMLRSKVARVQYELGASGASGSMQNIGQDTVLNLELVFPPLEEQVNIAAAIRHGNERLDKMADITTREIEKLREYRAALITAAVTGRIDVRAAVAVPELVEA